MTSRWIRISSAVLGVLVPAVASQADGGRSSVVWTRGAARTEIRLAVSQDGLVFREVEGVLLRGGAAPSIVRLSGGDLVAVFDYGDEGSKGDVTVPAVARSDDQGRSWSALKPITFAGGDESPVKPRHIELIGGDREFVRMLFTHDRFAEGKTEGEAAPTIAAASSRDGLRFRLDNPSCIPPIEAADLHPIVAELNRDMRLYVQARRGDRKTKTQRADLSVFCRASGSTFKPVGESTAIEADFVGCVLASECGVRAYVSAQEGVVSLVSKDARLWSREDGVRLENGWDPAVVKLRDGSLLMLYCAPLSEKKAGEDELVAVDRTAFRRALSAAASISPGTEDWTDTSKSETAQVVVADGSAASESAEDAWAQSALEPLLADKYGFAGIPEEDIDVAGNSDTAPDGVDFPLSTEVTFDSDGFSPIPDFVNRIDYAAHYRALLDPGPDDAYPYYARLMMDPEDEFARRPDWPEFNDMFNGEMNEGPPAPWSGEDHPEWAASSDEVTDLLSDFREATRHEGYATPMRFVDDDLKAFDGKPLLFAMRLPQLGAHRTMVKATLADAWRVGEDGSVPPDRMRDAIETTMRGAGHMTQGGTIIEHLVGVAERALTQDVARQALHQGVFSTEEEIADTLEVLMRHDNDDRDPTLSMRFEHMANMDAIQALFPPGKPSGETTINLKLAESIAGMVGDGESNEALAAMTGEDARESAEIFDDHYHRMAEMWQIGYPEVRAADMEAAEERDAYATPLTKAFMPALSRYYKLATREETSRRATKLAYATHLFQKQNGRWPDSLDELPAEYGEEMRTDPFTGDYFGYRVDANGPRIYSMSENGIDDGGVHARRWDDDPVGGSDDHVYWPPQPR